MQLDNKQRKLFIGDSKGKIFTFKVKNGLKIKEFEEHKQEVTGLSF